MMEIDSIAHGNRSDPPPTWFREQACDGLHVLPARKQPVVPAGLALETP